MRHDPEPDSAAVAAPDFMTVEEAADVIRIGRTAAYQLARLYLTSGGAAGLPAVKYGKQTRVPRHKLEEMLGGPITWPPPSKRRQPAETAPVTLAGTPPVRRRSTRRATAAEQSLLFE